MENILVSVFAQSTGKHATVLNELVILMQRIIVRNQLLFLIIFIGLITNNCDKNPFNYDTKEDNIIGIYALKENQNYFGYDLHYSNYDSISFKKIEDCYDLLSLHINKKNNLLIGASQDKLYFINTITNKKIKEISVPDTENPDPYFSLTEIYLFSDPLNPDYLILCNWSIYLVNLKKLTLEKVLLNTRNSDKITYTHGAALNADDNSLYLLLMLLGVWQEGEYWKYEARQRLLKLDLNTGQTHTIYDYPIEKAPGAKFIFCNKYYIISYDPNHNIMLRFSVSSGAIIDSFMVTQTDRLRRPYPTDDYFFLQDYKNGTFYKLDPRKKEIEIYMPFSYQRFSGTTYQKMNCGDVYVCGSRTSEGTSLIINLSQKELVREFNSDSTYIMILKEDEQ